LLAATVVALARVPKLGFWGVWFFITLAPASSVVPIPTEVAAERRMYLPLIAVVVLIVSGAERRTVFRGRAVAIGVAVLIALGAATAVRNSEYADGVRI